MANQSYVVWDRTTGSRVPGGPFAFLVDAEAHIERHRQGQPDGKPAPSYAVVSVPDED